METFLGEAQIFFVNCRKNLKEVEKDLVGLFTIRGYFEKLRKVVLAVKDVPPKDEAFFSSFNVFADLVLKGYVAFIVMGIRRHIKSKEESVSLLGLLEGIKKHPEYISKSYFISLYHCDDVKPTILSASGEDKEISDEEKKVAENGIKEHWKEVAEKVWEEISGDCESLSPEVIEKDICELKYSTLSKNIEDLADKYIAHLDREKKPSNVNLNVIDEFLSKIEEIYKRYSLLLTGSFLSSLEPVSQFNDEKFFIEFEKWLIEKMSKEE